MSPGDLVRRKMFPDECGLFLGFRTFDSKYECAEVMWVNGILSCGKPVSTIQKNLIELVPEH
jgi:hypothetical protein